MRDATALLGRIMLAGLFIWSGLGKLMAAGATTAYMAKSGLPIPELAYAVAVFIELGVGLALLAGLATRASGLVLAVWCIVTALVAHSDFANHAMLLQFYKNASIAGGLLYVAAYGGGAFSLDALFARRRATVTA